MKQIINKNGHLIINVNGVDVEPIAYMSYLPQKASYKSFKESGYNLFCACISIGGMPVNELSGIHPFNESIWKSKNEFDFSVVDKIIKNVLGDNPTGFIILRINLNMPLWWREENPDEIVKFNNRRVLMQSTFSKKWLKDCRVFFEKLKEHIDASDYRENIIAWQLAAMGTEEWIAPVDGGKETDFSLCAKNSFIDYCKSKYKNIANLNKNWQSDYLDFSDITIPSLDQRHTSINNESGCCDKNLYVYDWYVCFNQSYAEAIENLCKMVKTIYKGDILVGTFYGYIGQLPYIYGHCCIGKILHSKYIDFFASPFAYTEHRQTTNDWFYHGPMESCRKAGKMWFIEADIRTFKTKSLCVTFPLLVDSNNSRMSLPVWHGPKTETESIWNLKRAFSKILTSDNAFWWFDMWGGWYDSFEMKQFMQKALQVYSSALGMPYNSASEVAVVLDEETSYGTSEDDFYLLNYKQLIALSNAGAPYDLLLKGDFSVDELSRYKCVIYLAPLKITGVDNSIISCLLKDGKTVIVTGKKTENSQTEIFYNDFLSETDLRKVYKQAAVHVYTDKTSLIFANQRYVAITAAFDDVYELELPENHTLISVFDEEKYITLNKKIKLKLKKGQCELFEIT